MSVLLDTRKSYFVWLVVLASYLIHYDTYYKMRQILLQNARAILLQNASDCLLQNPSYVLQNAKVIANYDVYYKMRR